MGFFGFVFCLLFLPTRGEHCDLGLRGFSRMVLGSGGFVLLQSPCCSLSELLTEGLADKLSD